MYICESNVCLVTVDMSIQSGTGSTDVYDLPYRSGEVKQGHVYKQHILLTTESFLQPKEVILSMGK